MAPLRTPRRIRPAPTALLLLPALCRGLQSDLNVWIADPSWDSGSPPEVDTCYDQTAFGTQDAQAGCGIPIAVDGVTADPSTYQDQVTFIANARNAIFITTKTWETADIGSATQDNVSIALQVSSETSDGVVLCPESAVLREGYDEGLKMVGLTDLNDPTSWLTTATVWATDQGNSFFIIPYTLRPVHAPPYPQLTIVLIPRKITQNIHTNCTVAAEGGIAECECTLPWVLQSDDTCMKFELETLDTIELRVNVRTEPALETLRAEYVENCEYAFAQDHIQTLAGTEMIESAAPPAAGQGAAVWGWRLLAGASAAVLHAGRHRRLRT